MDTDYEVNQYEKLFNEESFEKKKVAHGIHNRASRKGYFKHGVLMPVDYLHGKEKKEYTKGSVMRVSNLYDEIIPYAQFIKLSNEDQKRYLTVWDGKYKRKEIAESWDEPIWKVSGFYGKYNMTRTAKSRIESQLKTIYDVEPQSNGFLTWEDLMSLSMSDRTTILNTYLDKYDRKTSALAQAWGIKTKLIIDLCYRMKIPTNKSYSKSASKIEEDISMTNGTTGTKYITTAVTPNNSFYNAFLSSDAAIMVFQINPKKMTGKQIQQRILAMAEMLEDDKTYTFQLKLSEEEQKAEEAEKAAE